ncbi:MAG: DUF3237 domain-containing protein [Porticoccaceae bacterium]
MKLKPLLTMHADLKPPVDVGPGPYGNRMIFDVIGGTFTGDKLRGTLLPSGGDWILIDEQGVGKLDVRITLQTEDGALLYVQYHGVLAMNEAVNVAIGGGKAMDFGDTYFMTQPRVETGDERYRWLNDIVAVAEGRVVDHAVEYKVYQLVND